MAENLPSQFAEAGALGVATRGLGSNHIKFAIQSRLPVAKVAVSGVRGFMAPKRALLAGAD